MKIHPKKFIFDYWNEDIDYLKNTKKQKRSIKKLLRKFRRRVDKLWCRED